MITRTVELSSAAAHLAVQDSQLVFMKKGTGHSAELLGTVPLEDLGLLMIDQLQTTVSIAALSALAERGAAVCVCGRNHLPQALLLPFSDRHEMIWRINDQIAMRQATKKRIWRQLIRAKLLAQLRNLAPSSPAATKLRALREAVRSGDHSNIEARASKLYWRYWLGGNQAFRRIASPTRQGPPPNGLLDYGYAVLRAAVARAIVSAGLMPSIGIHHKHRSNPFCLADDLVEPLRPIVDGRVRQLVDSGIDTCTRESKQALLGLLTTPVRIESQSPSPRYITGPLAVALPRYVASFVACIPRIGLRQKLAIPTVATVANSVCREPRD